MASSLVRRPLPALIALFALLLLTALVWWRVLHRNDDKAALPSCPTPTPTGAPTQTLPAPSTVTVQVLNGTYKLKKQARSGIAGKAATKLIKDGFKVPNAAADDKKHKVQAVAEIRYGPKGKPAATLLDYYFGQKAKLVPTQTKSAVVTVSLGRRYTKLTAKSAVTRALAADHVSLTSPRPSHTPSGAATCTPVPATTSTPGTSTTPSG
jgi:hypothetical protein